MNHKRSPTHALHTWREALSMRWEICTPTTEIQITCAEVCGGLNLSTLNRILSRSIYVGKQEEIESGDDLGHRRVGGTGGAQYLGHTEIVYAGCVDVWHSHRYSACTQATTCHLLIVPRTCAPFPSGIWTKSTVNSHFYYRCKFFQRRKHWGSGASYGA